MINLQVYLQCDDGLTPEVQGLRGSTIVDITFATSGIVKKKLKKSLKNLLGLAKSQPEY